MIACNIFTDKIQDDDRFKQSVHRHGAARAGSPPARHEATLHLQRVNTDFQSTIQGSAKIQRAMFIQGSTNDETEDVWVTLNPLVGSWTPTKVNLRRFSLEVCYTVHLEPSFMHAVVGNYRGPRSSVAHGPTWRKTRLADTASYLNVDVSIGQHGHQCKIFFTMRSSETLGQLADIAESYHERALRDGVGSRLRLAMAQEEEYEGRTVDRDFEWAEVQGSIIGEAVWVWGLSKWYWA